MTLSRRHLLAAAPAAAIAGSATSMTASAQSARAAQAPGYYRYRVGDIAVTAVNDGVGERPVEGFIRNADLGEVKAALTAAFMPTDKLQLTFTSLVLQIGGKTILIDTGNGDMGPPTAGRWMANFRAAGFEPSQVDTIVISHFHGDHINGMRLKDGTAVFARAEVLVPTPEWSFWMDDAKMNAAPEGARAGFANVRRVFGPIADKIRKFDWESEIVPGVTALAAPGHTPGHTAFDIASGDSRLLVLSDTTNHPALFVRHPDWSAVFDMNADEARSTRRRLLDLAAQQRRRVAFYHAPFPATGHIAKRDEGFEFIPSNWTSEI